MNYEQETRAAYQSTERARAYKRHLTEEMSWARFAMWHEKCCIVEAIKLCGVSPGEKILDVPCGTGIMARTLEGNCPGRFTASDISREMMDLARHEYSADRMDGLVRSDITRLPFRSREFSGTLVIGFMHRVPPVIRRATLQEIARVTERFIIVSYSRDSLLQRIKRVLLSQLSSRYSSAPSPACTDEIRREYEGLGLKVIKRFHVLWGFSSEVIYVFEKTGQ